MNCKLVLLGAGAIACAGALVWFGLTLRRASSEVTEAVKQVAHEGQLEFRSIALDRRPPSGFESISSPAQFTDAALFDGKLYVCGPTGLIAFNHEGAVSNEYHVGIELPPAPLVRMAVDRQLWIATHGEGLLIFDGSTFQQVRPVLPGARALTSVLPLASGRVLLGTEKSGVLVWDGKALTALHPSLNDLHVTALAGTEADLWVGTVDDGALHWHAGQLDHFTDAEGLPDNRVLSIATSGETAYIGTGLGVAEFQAGRYTRTLAPGVFAKALLVHGAALAVGTLEQGVIEVPLQAQRPRLRMNTASSEMAAIERVLELDGRLLALAEDGLYDNGRRLFDTPNARLTDRNIAALSVDSAGKLWVGYFDRGLDILAGERTHVEDAHVFCVNRIVHAADGSLTAVGTANGLVLFDASGKIRQVLTKADGLIASNVTDILLRPNGLTVATPAGLSMIDPGGLSSLYAFHGLVNNHVYALASNGSKLLVGTLGGLSMLEAGVIRANYTTANSGLKQNWITAIQPVDQDWFIGTYGSGVVKLDSAGRWSAFPDLKGHTEINPNALAPTRAAVYAGTLGKGLAVYNRTSARWSFVTNGLPSANVTAVAASGGQIYVGTDNGLVRIQETAVPVQ